MTENRGETALTVSAGARDLQQQMLAKADSAFAMIEAVGKKIADSNLGKLKNPADGFMVAAYCFSNGIDLATFFQSHHVIEGKITRTAEFMLAEFYRLGGKAKWLQTDDKAASAEFAWDGQTLTATYTIEDARRMLGKEKDNPRNDRVDNPAGNWVKSRPAMLRSRLITTTFRFLCPSISGGFYTQEELEDVGIVEQPEAAVKEAKKRSRKEELEQMAATANSQVVITEAVVTGVEMNGGNVVGITTKPQIPAGAVLLQDQVIDVVAEPVSTPAPTPQPVADIPFDVGPPKASGLQLQQLAKLGAACGYSMAETTTWASNVVGREVATFTSDDIAPLIERLQALADLVAAASPKYERDALMSMLSEATGVASPQDIPTQQLKDFLPMLQPALKS